MFQSVQDLSVSMQTIYLLIFIENIAFDELIGAVCVFHDNFGKFPCEELDSYLAIVNVEQHSKKIYLLSLAHKK